MTKFNIEEHVKSLKADWDRCQELKVCYDNLIDQSELIRGMEALYFEEGLLNPSEFDVPIKDLLLLGIDLKIAQIREEFIKLQDKRFRQHGEIVCAYLDLQKSLGLSQESTILDVKLPKNTTPLP